MGVGAMLSDHAKRLAEARPRPDRPVLPIVNSCGGAYIDVTLVYSGQDVRHFEMSNAEALALLLALAKALARD